MSFLGGLFGGGSSTTVQNTTRVDVQVNPNIGVQVGVDTRPIADAVAQAGQQEADAIAQLGQQQNASDQAQQQNLEEAVHDVVGGLNKVALWAGFAAVLFFVFKRR